ncbi:unnamed protein product, partial [Arabidopsis halleri]
PCSSSSSLSCSSASFPNSIIPLPKSLNSLTYNGFHPPLTNISIQGIATVTSNSILKLTNIGMQRTGHAFYTKPIRLKDSPNGNVYTSF